MAKKLISAVLGKPGLNSLARSCCRDPAKSLFLPCRSRVKMVVAPKVTHPSLCKNYHSP